MGGGGNQRTPPTIYIIIIICCFLLPGRETLHPFVAMAPGSVTSKLIITIKISSSAREKGGRRQVGGHKE